MNIYELKLITRYVLSIKLPDNNIHYSYAKVYYKIYNYMYDMEAVYILFKILYSYQ